MKHTTNTHVVFADNAAAAKEQFLAMGVTPDHDENAVLDVCKCSEEEDFDFASPFNLIGEVSLSPEYMATVNQDPERAYVIYYIEEV